jgi:hypothetical protein
LPQTSAQNQLPTQNLSTIANGLKRIAFNDVPKVELQHKANNNTSTTAPGSSHSLGGTSSTQTNGGAPPQSPPRASLLIRAIQYNAKLEQIQVEDWEDETFEDEVVEEVELARVHQEIGRIRQEQEAITRRQASTQCVKARRQHINRQRARLKELPYIVEILRQQEQKQVPPFEQLHHHNNPNHPTSPLLHFQNPTPPIPTTNV